MNIEQAKERLKSIVDFYKLNDETNYDYSDDVLISMKLVLEEIERLNNIINELEKWLEEQIKISQAHDNELGVNVCNTFKNKLKEIKGDSSNE